MVEGRRIRAGRQQRADRRALMRRRRDVERRAPVSIAALEQRRRRCRQSPDRRHVVALCGRMQSRIGRDLGGARRHLRWRSQRDCA